MNTINQSASQIFSWPRFWSLLKTFVIENSKTFALYAGGLIGISVIVGLFAGYIFLSHGYMHSNIGASQALMLMYITISGSLCLSISASLTFSSLKTRASRISTFMLPASLFEKFLVRVLVYLIGLVVSFVIAVALGDGARMLVISDSETIFSLLYSEFIRYINVSSMVYVVFYFVGLTLFSHSIFTLGSALWPKNSFLKTYLLTFVMVIIIAAFIPSGIFFRDVIFHNKWTAISSLYIADILFYCLAWLRFKHTQIVQRFMMD